MGTRDTVGPDRRVPFGVLLRRYRQAAGLTQEALAERSDLSAQGLSALENGRRQVPYRHTVRLLAQALGLDAAETAALEAAVVRVRTSAGAATVAAHIEHTAPGQALLHLLPAPSERRTNLPAPLTRVIGREREQADVAAALDDARLVTLTGAGGLGKSRLAVMVAGTLLDAYPDGVWLVELAALADPALVPQVVAQALGVQEHHDRPFLDVLSDALMQRRLLLVIDNCEHLIGACAEVATALLQRCPQLRLLATSREPLEVAGEVLYRVPSLSVPDLNDLSSPDHLVHYEAVRLFLARARARCAAFTLSRWNAGAVAQICVRLDGMPLAIEMAAARVGALSVETIAARLGDRFRLLTGGPRAALPRQQTLRATLDWSHDLLGQAEQVLLRRLAVFAGGWTVEAAEWACAGGAVAGEDVLHLLCALINKSLIQVEDRDGRSRYWLLETVRAYALERLMAAGEEAAVREAHAAWCVELAETAEPLLRGPEQGHWLDDLEAEHDNLRAALRWSLREGTPVLALRLSAALWRFWYARGHLTEGRRWLEHALAGCEGETVPAELHTRARTGVWNLAWRLSQVTRELCEADLAHMRALNNAHGIAATLERLGGLAYADNDHEQARMLHEESLALRRTLNDCAGVAASLEGLADVAYKQGELDRAWMLHGESLRLRRELGDRIGIAISLSDRARVAYARGDLVWARRLADEGLAVYRELGDRWGVAYALDTLGLVASAQGNDALAQTLWEQCVRICCEQDNWWGLTRALEGFARLRGARSQPERGAQLWGAADAQRLAHDSPRPPSEQAAYERALDTVRRALGADALSAACAAGRALTLQEALALALDTAMP